MAGVLRLPTLQNQKRLPKRRAGKRTRHWHYPKTN